MKPYHFIAPLIALGAGVYWIAGKESTLSELETRTRTITERIALLERSSTDTGTTGTANGSGTKEKPDEFTLPDGSLDWETIADLIAKAETGGGMPTDMKTMLKLRQKFMLMTEGEIENGLAKIKDLDLAEAAHKHLARSLLQMMAEKNPQKALELIANEDASGRSPLRWIRQHAFDKLTREDPASALSWINQQVEDGKFQSKALDPGENPRIRLESILLGRLAENDLATVKERLNTFSPDERQRLLADNHHWRVDGKMPESFLSVAREFLTEEQATSAIVSAWTNHHTNKLTDISKHLEDIPFSEKEHEAVVKQALQNAIHDNPKGEDYNNIYEWAKEHDPEGANAMVAESLVREAGLNKRLEENFEKSLELAKTFNDPAIATEFVTQLVRKKRDLKVEELTEIKNPETAAKLKAIYESLPQDEE